MYKLLDLHKIVQYNIFDMEIQPEKYCENCYYFYQHYYKSTHGKIVAVSGDGHCTNGNLTKAVSRKNILRRRACEFWEIREPLITEQRASVYRAILKMQKSLEELVLILKED